jgi:hypothetical protein
MKAPDSFYNATTKICARDFRNYVRRILTKKHLADGEHWIRFKNVGGANFHNIHFDFLEIVPLNIVSDPNKPEDRH